MGFPEALSLSVLLIHHFRQVFLPDYILGSYKAVVGKFLLVDQHWNIHVLGPLDNVTSELVLAYPAVSHMSSTSYLDDFRDGR